MAQEAIQDLTERLPLEIIGGTTLVLIGLYYGTKMFDVAMIEFWQRKIAVWNAPGRF